MLTRLRTILAKIEATEGVAETLTSTDNPLLVKDLKVNPNVNMYKRAILLPTLSNLPDLPGGTTATIGFSVELKGPGQAFSDTVKPYYADYLKVCGFGETTETDATTGDILKYIYQPISLNIPSLTIGVYEDGIVHRIAGCRGTVRFSGQVGQPVIAEFEFTGVWLGAQDEAMPSISGLDISNPPVCLATGVTIDSYTPVMTKFTLDIANSVEMREDITSSTGYKSALITGRDPKGNIDPEAVTVATYDFFGKWKNGESFALDITVGDTQYNKVSFSAPNARITSISEDDRNGIMVYNIDFVMATNSASGDDEIQIIFE